MKKNRQPPFVMLIKETLDAPAWRHMSHGARNLYIALKRRYHSDFKNNGKIYLSQRDAAKEVRGNLNSITRWFRELQYYGFIRMAAPGYLGVDGVGKAPRWRLTEVGYMRDPPSRDFMRWNGVRFSKHQPGGDRAKPKTESRSRKGGRTVAGKGDTTVAEKGDTQWNKRSRKGGHTAHPSVAEKGDITSLPLVGASSGAPRFYLAADTRPPWTTPVLTEVKGPVEAAAIRAAAPAHTCKT